VRNLAVLASLFLATACTADVASFEDEGSTSGASVASISPDLSGCHGTASSTIPSDGDYVMTTFGGGADTQAMSCGGTANGTGYYAASRQRYGCGAHLKVQANGKCIVLAAMDYGPDTCVEAAAHSPILDMSPAASKLLYGVSGAGWSDHLTVNVEEVDSSTPLGPCAADTGTTTGSDDGSDDSGDGGGTTTTSAASCSSSTLDRDVDSGDCVQSASDGDMYQCADGEWDAVSSTGGCANVYAYCYSPTLGKSVPARSCVQSASSGIWYQCNGQEWVTPVDKTDESGPIGDCSQWDPN
jgi:hypothetical protein